MYVPIKTQHAFSTLDVALILMSLMSKTISLTVNGETQTSSVNVSLPQFLQSLGMNPRLVAVEYNGEILHRQFWETTEMNEGDRLEIVTIVGGG